MKKMLFIGAMLIVGITAFGGRIVDLGPSPSGNSSTVSGDASLGIMAKGEVVDESTSVLLIVKPTLSAGDDDASLHFRFGDIKSGSSKAVDGEFTVEVLSKGEPVPMADSLTVTLKNEGGEDISNKTVELLKTNAPNGDLENKMGTLQYSLTEEKENSNKLYTGKIVSNVKLDQGKTGSFSDNSCYVDISLNNLTISQK